MSAARRLVIGGDGRPRLAPVPPTATLTVDVADVPPSPRLEATARALLARLVARSLTQKTTAAEDTTSISAAVDRSGVCDESTE